MPKVGYRFIVQKEPVVESGGASLVKKLHLDIRIESCEGVRKSAGHVINQKDVDELLARSAIKPSTGGSDICSMYLLFLSALLVYNSYSVFSNLRFKMPTMRQVLQCIQQNDYAFSIDVRDTYLHIPIVKQHRCCFTVCFQHKPNQWKGFDFTY